MLARYDLTLLQLCCARLWRGRGRQSRRLKGAARSGAGTAIELARAARDNLIRALDRFAGRRATKLEQISRARNKSPGDDGIVESIKNLVALGELAQDRVCLLAQDGPPHARARRRGVRRR